MNGSVPENVQTTSVEVGQGNMRFRVQKDWPRTSKHWHWVEVAGVATDSRSRVYVFNRGERPMAVFSPDGDLVDSWGEGIFQRAHGITIGPDDVIYCADDLDHTVKAFSLDGQLLFTWGRSGQPSDTGAKTVDYREIKRAGPPFNYPTNVAVAPDGTIYVSDGYGNARVHRFSANGQLLTSWGEPGAGPGQFHVPHGIAVDAQGTVYVADRENSRIQRFGAEGGYLDEWAGVARPCEIFIDTKTNVYVAELGYRAGLWPGTHPPPTATGGRVSVFDAQGERLAQWGGGNDPCAPGDFFAPHDIHCDAEGNVYVSEVTMSAGGNRGLVSPNCHSIQKFIWQPEKCS